MRLMTWRALTRGFTMRLMTWRALKRGFTMRLMTWRAPSIIPHLQQLVLVLVHARDAAGLRAALVGAQVHGVERLVPHAGPCTVVP